MAVYAIKNKTGTVYRYRFMIGGKEVQSRTYQSRNECREAEIKARAEALDNIFAKPCKYTLAEAFDEYRRLCPVRYSSQKNRDVVVKHLRSAEMADIIVSKVRPIHLERFAAFLREAGYKQTSCRTYLNILFGLFNWMVKIELLTYNPTTPLSLPEENFEHKDVLSASVLQARLAYIKENYYPLYAPVLLMGFCGLRTAEACAVNINDVDLVDGLIHVDKQYSFNGKEFALSTTKTKDSVRVVPIMDYIYPAVKEHIRYVKKLYLAGQLQLAQDEDIPFCVGEKGKRLLPHRAAHYWNLMEEEAGWKHIRFYNLRHTFATICRDAEVNIDVIADLLGHSDVTVTKKIYAGKSTEQIKKAARKVTAFFEENNKKKCIKIKTSGL